MVALASTVFLPGCTDPSTVDDAPTRAEAEAFRVVIESLEGEAADAGASQRQMDLLADWKSSGSASYEELMIAVQASFACLEDAGIPYSYSGPAMGQDFPEIVYTHGANADLGDEQSYNVAEACITRESGFAEVAYQLSPGVYARRERDAAAFLPIAVACLEERGIVVDPEMTLEEVASWLLDTGHVDDQDCTDPGLGVRFP